MRLEPIELSLAAAKSGRRLRERSIPTPVANHNSEACAIDEAFAHFADQPERALRCEPGEPHMVTQSIVADLASQLESIDRQRERLAQLLQSVTARSVAH